LKYSRLEPHSKEQSCRYIHRLNVFSSIFHRLLLKVFVTESVELFSLELVEGSLDKPSIYFYKTMFKVIPNPNPYIICEIVGATIVLDFIGFLRPNMPQPKDGIIQNHGKILVKNPNIIP